MSDVQCRLLPSCPLWQDLYGTCEDQSQPGVRRSESRSEASVVRDGTRKKNWGLGTPFNNFIPQARFLFGKDVDEYLSNAVKQWTEPYAVEAESDDPTARVKNAARRRELTNWFFEQASTGVRELFGPYLDFERWK